MQKLLAMMLLGLSVVSANENTKLVSDAFGFKDDEIGTALETLNGKEKKCPEMKSVQNNFEKAVDFYAKTAKQHNEKMKDFQNKKEELVKNRDEGIKNTKDDKEKEQAESTYKTSLEALEKEIKDYQQSQEDAIKTNRESIQNLINEAQNVACKKEIEDTGYGKKDEKGNELPYDLTNLALKDNQQSDSNNRNFVASALHYKDRLDLCQKDLRRLEGFLNTKGNEKLRLWLAKQSITTTLEKKNIMDVDAGHTAGDFDRKYMGMEAALRAEHEQCKNVKIYIADKIVDYYTNGDKDAKGQGNQYDKKNKKIKDPVQAKIDELDGMMKVFGDGSVFKRADVKLTFDAKRAGQELDNLIKVFNLNKNTKQYSLNPKNLKNITPVMINDIKEMANHIAKDPWNDDTKNLNDRLETLLKCLNDVMSTTGPVIKEMGEKGIDNKFRVALQDALTRIKAGK